MTAPKAPSPPLVVHSHREYALAGLAIARGYASAGVHEEGGNNRGDQVSFFQSLLGGSPGESWCAFFVSACLVKGYARLNSLPEDRESLRKYVHTVNTVLLPLSGSCEELHRAAVSRLLFRGKDYKPNPGDLVLYDFSGSGVPHHVGIIITQSDIDQLLHTVEGNTQSGNAGSQGDGDGVFVRIRPKTRVFGYVSFG
jgi:hypothetical protein